MPVKFTATVIKADVGSPAGHTKPSEAMLQTARERIRGIIDDGTIRDGKVTYTGDDTALTMIHEHGVAAPVIHDFAWATFLQMTEVAREEGLYAAGQDLLVDAPSGNVRGAGPGVAELDLIYGTSERPVESFMVFTGDKCAPGIFNLPLRLVFGNPDHNTGLLLSPDLFKGFTFEVIDMNYTEGDKIIKLNLPEDYLVLTAILRNPDRFAVESVWSRAYPEHQIVSVAATRLHNVKGTYTGKDDPAMIIRTQRIFPAPEEVLHPWGVIDQIVTGDCRGSHNMPICPLPINTAVSGPYCFPIINAVGWSVNTEGVLAEMQDFFDNPIWDFVRLRVQEYGMKFRQQGAHGVALAAQEELAYTGLKQIDGMLAQRFEVR